MYLNGRHSLFNDSRRAWGLGWGTYAWLLVSLLSIGCTIAPNTIGPNPVAPITVAPIEETRLFLKAFVAVDEGSRTLFNDFAIAERRQGKLNAETIAKMNARRGDGYQGACGMPWAMVDRTSGYIAGFCVEDAPYFSELGDPPCNRSLASCYSPDRRLCTTATYPG